MYYVNIHWKDISFKKITKNIFRYLSLNCYIQQNNVTT